MRNELIEVGDVFIISFYNEHCLYRDKRYVVNSFSKSRLSIYYNDTRTNVNCKCNNCYRGTGVSKKDPLLRSIGILNITIVEKRVVALRSNKLKQLGI